MLSLIKKLLEVKTFQSICILFSILITIAFLIPIKESQPLFDFIIPIDKFIHLLIYLILSFLWLSYLYIAKWNDNLLTNILIVFLSCFLYGIIIEVIQELLIPLRKADVLDVLSNMVGVILGTLLFWNVKKRIKS